MKNNIQIIIPMSGEGSRFKNVGYKNIKPLIKINGKPIIEYVISMFSHSQNFIFVCQDKHLLETPLKKILQNLQPKGKIISVKQAKKGPVFAVSQAYKHINDDNPVIVSYCDFYQLWNDQDFYEFVQTTNCDGAIPCYKDFHPHLLHEKNYYASCKTNSNNQVLEIKEKHSFTKNKQESPQSSGIYYFKTGKIMKQYFSNMIQNGPALNGEYYVSLVYNHMITNYLDVRVYDKIGHFCQWGTPQDLEEYLYWDKIFTHSNSTKKTISKVKQKLIPMAGSGSRFASEGYQDPKPLIKVDNLPMVVSAVTHLPESEKNIFICQEKHLNQYPLKSIISQFFPNSEFISAKGLTEGQACTCLLAKDNLNLKEDLLIGSCDNGMIYSLTDFWKKTKTSDCIVFTFRNNPTVVHKPKQYGWVKVLPQSDKIQSISVKKPISSNPLTDHAIVGAFWFKEANTFVQAAKQMIQENHRINGEFYIDQLINNVLKLGKKSYIFEVDNYICWGTPNDLKIYNYWKSYFKNVKTH